MTYISLYLTARLAIAIGIAGVLTGDTIWLAAERDGDILSTINPWVTFALSILILVWGVVSEEQKQFFDEILWVVHIWWVVLFVRLAFSPQPAQVDGFDRASWLFVYSSMSILTLGLWLSARKTHIRSSCE